MVKILAIDDQKEHLLILNAVIREVLPDALVFTASNGTDGIESALEHDPDVILLDVMMPGRNGYDVCRYLKQLAQVRDIPVVFLTSLESDKESRIEALDAGAEGFLQKPIDEAELTAQIRAMVKVKMANKQKHEEKEHLQGLIERRTHELGQSQLAMLMMMDDLRTENESRKFMEAELRESERFSRATIDALTKHLCVLDEHGVILTVNKAWRRFAEENPPVLINVMEGANYLEVCDTAKGDDAAQAAAFAAGIRSVLKGERDKFTMEYACHSPTKQRWFAGSVTPFAGPGLVRVVVTHENITDRKKAEAALLLQNTAVQSAANAVVITDRQGAIVFVNQAFTQITGYSLEDVTGKNPRILKSGRQSENFYKTLWSTILSGAVWKGEIENKRKDGTIYTEEMTITPVRESGGEISHFISIKQDVTEQKRLQQQFFQSQKVQSIGTLAGGIAHDFNNILGIILGYTTMLEGVRENSQKFEECVSVITKNVDRGAALVQQILTYARKTDVLFDELDVPGFVHEITRMLEETFPKTIIFHERFATAMPQIMCDRTQIHQVILNLCVNARDAMPHGGTISITADVQQRSTLLARFPSASDRAYLCIRISDTGEGMDEATRLRVFDPFFTTKEQGKGTGLGLSVVYGIVQAHHGFVDVESRKGHGTTFSIFLPVRQRTDQAASLQEAQTTDIRGGSETILVVEDEDYLRSMVCMFLESKGYRVIKACDGREAIEVFGTHREAIDAILTDIGLPKMDGIHLIKTIREIDTNVAVIVASGFFEPAMKDDLLAHGVNGFINKPYRPTDVLKTMRQILDRKTA